VNILEGAISGKKAVGTTVLKASRQKHRSLQQFQMESCQPIKRLKDKKKKIIFQNTISLFNSRFHSFKMNPIRCSKNLKTA
jgi:hypothetical protein